MHIMYVMKENRCRVSIEIKKLREDYLLYSYIVR